MFCRLLTTDRGYLTHVGHYELRLMRSVFAHVSPSLAEAERVRISTELASTVESTLARVRQGGADHDTVSLVLQVGVAFIDKAYRGSY